jgi:hypothetical protein
MVDNTAENIGGALAGGIVAIELLDTLLAKGILSNAEVRGVLRNAIKAVKASASTPEARIVVTVLERLQSERFPEH